MLPIAEEIKISTILCGKEGETFLNSFPEAELPILISKQGKDTTKKQLGWAL
jgi:hypothetical protein